MLDILSSQPVEGTTVTLRRRLITVDESGEKHLGRVEDGELLGTASTTADGLAIFSTEVSEAGFLSAEISAIGYETQIDTMLRVEVGKDAQLTILLVPQEMSPAKAAEVIQIHERMRHNEEIEQGPYVEQGDLHATAAMVEIPDEVRVENLEGFTGMMNLDEFIGGVVTREMNDGFPREALRTQAIASRSYALHRLRTRGMANGGQAYNSTSGSLSRAAALYTSKQVILYNGSIAQAFFSARCNGDFTLDSENGPTLTRCFPGGLTTAVVPYCRSRPCSGHINCFGTSEQCCEVTVNGKVNYIYGHGVGMCQRGAQGFANRGVTYSAMLTNFYTDIVIYNGALPNSLSVRLVPQSSPSGGNAFILEIRSTRPHTLFDVQSTSVLGGSWTSFSTERGLTTGPNSVAQIQPQGLLAAVKYFRTVLR